MLIGDDDDDILEAAELDQSYENEDEPVEIPVLTMDDADRGDADDRVPVQKDIAPVQTAEEKAQSRQLEHCRRMHTAGKSLCEAIERAREALAVADEGQARHVPVATIIEYAERVSYSNAAPCGQVAFAGAERNMFYQGWGTPSPQQHMVAASRFAHAPEDEGSETVAEVPKDAAPVPLDAPAFTAVAPQQDPPGEERARISLGFDDSDDEDADFG